MNYTNYQILPTFLMLEKSTPIFWTVKTTAYNTNIFWINPVWYILFTQIIKYELYSHNSWMTDHSALDNSSNTNLYSAINKFKIFSIIQSYFNKFRWIIFTDINFDVPSIESIDKIFKNMNWLERESAEMYGINFTLKTDNRKLLLDYSKISHPMRKNTPAEEYQDTFYNILENQIDNVVVEAVEL